MKTLRMNTRRRELKRGTSQAWLFMMFLSAVGQTIAQPNVTIAGPANIATSYVGNAVGFSADAADGDGTVTNVEFYLDFSLIDAVSDSPQQLRLTFTNGPSGHRLRAQVNERAVSQFQGEAGNEISYRLAPQVRTEAGDKPADIYSPRLELRTLTPVNVLQSKKYPGIEYSGILAQVAKSNPLQLINPFAPAMYGDGEANIVRNLVRNLVTREAEGLKLWQISF